MILNDLLFVTGTSTVVIVEPWYVLTRVLRSTNLSQDNLTLQSTEFCHLVIHEDQKYQLTNKLITFE